MKKAIPHLFILLFTFFLLCCSSDKEQKFYFSSSKTPEPIYDSLWATFYLHLDLKNLEGALAYADSIKSLAKLHENKKWIAKSYKAIGYIYYEQGLLKESTNFYLKASKLFQEVGLLKDLADVYINLGTQYYDNQDYHNAISFYTKALKIYHYEGEGANKAIAYRSMAMCKNKLQNYLEAEILLNQAKNSAESSKDYYTLGLIFNTWGTILADQHKFSDARQHYFKTLKFADSLNGNIELKSLATNNIGETYFLEGKNSEAKVWLNKAINIKKELNNSINNLYTYNLLAKVLINEDKHQEAIILLEEALSRIEPEAVDISIDEGLSLLNNALITHHKRTNHQNYKVINEKLTTYNQMLLAYNQNVSETKERLETITQQQDIKEAMEKHDLIQQLAEYEKRNTYMQYAFLIPVILLIGAVVSVYLSMRRNKEYKRLFSRIDETLSKSRALRHLNKK